MSMDAKKLSNPESYCLRFRQHGLSLVELMVGMLIGLILLGGIIQTMLASKQASITQRSMAAITDDARFLFDFMARDLRMAGRGYPDDSDWPESSGTPQPPIEFNDGVLTIRYIIPFYEDVDGDGNDEEYKQLVVVNYDQEGTVDSPGSTLLYSRQVIKNGAATNVMTNETLIAGLEPVAYNVTFGEFNDAGTPNDVSDDITTQKTAASVDWEKVVSVLLSFSFPSPSAEVDATPKEIKFTVALRNRIEQVIP